MLGLGLGIGASGVRAAPGSGPVTQPPPGPVADILTALPGGTVLWPDPRYWFQDSAGTLPVTAEGQRIRCWVAQDGTQWVQTGADSAAPVAGRFPNGEWGVLFGGAQWLVSQAAVDLSGQTQAALFIGARKTADATNGVLIEQGPNATTAPGFNIFAPAGTIEYRQWLRVGSSNTSISFDSDLYAAPHSAALTGLFTTGAQQVARVNGTQQATAAPAGMLARDVIHLGARAGANSFFSGLIGPVVLRGGPLPDSVAIATIEAIVTARVAAADPAATIATLGYVLDGDSLTEGYGVAPSYPTQLGTITGLPFTNLGVSGRTLATMDSTFASRGIAAQFNAAGRNTLVILGGINDIMNTAGITLAALQASMTSYLGKARAAGFKVLVGLLPPVAGFTTARETLRSGFNDWIRANAATLADGVVDLPAMADLGDPANLYFYLDGLHPTKRGHARIAEAVRVATGAALVSDTMPAAFTFATVAGAAPSTAITSAEIEVEGITGPTPISITGGSHSINGAAFTSGAGTVRPHDRLRVRVTSAAAADTGVSAIVTIGGVTGTFTATTAAPAPVTAIVTDTFETLTGWTFRAFNSSYSANPISSARGSVVDGTMRIMAASNAIYPQGYRTLSGLTIGRTYTVRIDHIERSKASAGQPEAYGFKIMVLDANNEFSLNSSHRLSVENIIPEETHAFQFTATQTTHHLMIQSGAGVANAFNRFDNISVTPTD
ncbi:MAG: SGNH/GDSL hydrolase family protein [Paracoccus hibiscisoli]|uniref:SGNH/GDSL hydrolase family protein n=1 Tax=Paracoccus hibiscisoli TaxID=2023261 RepID=UPI003918E805